MKKVYYNETVIGKIGIAEEYGFVTNLYFMNMKQPLDAKVYETDIIKEAFAQLNEFLSGSRKDFDLPLNPSGSDFQQMVWSELLNIGYGELITYGEIAENLRIRSASRAVGGAINKNPVPIIIPCHRVVGANNDLTGYVGGLDVKKSLLESEGHVIDNKNFVMP